MVGFANPDQHVRPLGYSNCVPEGFDSSIEFAIVLGGDEQYFLQLDRQRLQKFQFLLSILAI